MLWVSMKQNWVTGEHRLVGDLILYSTWRREGTWRVRRNKKKAEKTQHSLKNTSAIKIQLGRYCKMGETRINVENRGRYREAVHHQYPTECEKASIYSVTINRSIRYMQSLLIYLCHKNWRNSPSNRCTSLESLLCDAVGTNAWRWYASLVYLCDVTYKMEW